MNMGFSQVIRELNREINGLKVVEDVKVGDVKVGDVKVGDVKVPSPHSAAPGKEGSPRRVSSRHGIGSTEKVMRRDTSNDNFMKYQWSWVL
jgi:hypothetical protein